MFEQSYCVQLLLLAGRKTQLLAAEDYRSVTLFTYILYNNRGGLYVFDFEPVGGCAECTATNLLSRRSLPKFGEETRNAPYFLAPVSGYVF